MTEKEVRMRAIEALSGGGIREPSRLIRDAAELAAWVMAAEDAGEPEQAPRRAGRPPKADKGEAAPA
jgi:hypothetical protein